jgi:hypothetical protein
MADETPVDPTPTRDVEMEEESIEQVEGGLEGAEDTTMLGHVEPDIAPRVSFLE